LSKFQSKTEVVPRLKRFARILMLLPSCRKYSLVTKSGIYLARIAIRRSCVSLGKTECRKGRVGLGWAAGQHGGWRQGQQR
jgi:hypothetical protein